MMQTSKCGECGQEVAGQSYLILNHRAGRVCIPCMDRLTSTAGVPSKPSNFINWYIERKTLDPKDRRIKELEARLATLETMLGSKAPGNHPPGVPVAG